MNLKFFHPLFVNTEIDEASKYLSEYFVDATINSIFKIDTSQNSTDYILNSLLNNIKNDVFVEASRNQIYNMIKNTYGINAPIMANCYIVQDEWVSRYRETIMDYARALNFQIKEYCIIPNTVFTPAFVLKKFGKDKESLMKKFFPPDEIWDYSNIEKRSSAAACISPLNGLSRIFIEFNVLDRPKFTSKIASHFFNKDTVEKIIECVKNKTDSAICIPILPSSNFTRVFTLLRDCFKYL